MSDKKGVIYILTNPSFPDYVKIGYADDIEKRLKQLNRSECIPFAFRVYATYEVNSRLSDLKLHSIIDKLNPDLRSIDDFNGQKRVREFYAMKPEEAYAILEAMAEIHDCKEKLSLIMPNATEAEEEKIAQEIDTESHEKAENFSFEKCQIGVGEQIEYYDDPNIKCTVVSDRKVEYQGQEMSLTAAAKLISGKKYSIAGPRFFKYKGEWLNDIRLRMGF
ncbi:GIY-YIG nuclease family protein [Ruminococcus gauvreauii]|uniref:GIY-YIG nuclease family protein n=1 Tax=Ruminococcus gauvreauii TaxID=438033 RepID=A0ABY5VBU0_9FIRM|nr:GIY-YIG nuclease family protein [Ruminococcus gauvreauii]UWP58004.1 GIY-YIG nuclease family protein [Ruminococcus gauvreauii]